MTHIEYINAFIQRHKKHEWRVFTSPLREDESYVKIYEFDDDATLTEVNRPVYEPFKVKTTVKGIEVVVETTVKLLEIECWNTDNASSVKFYERW